MDLSKLQTLLEKCTNESGTKFTRTLNSAYRINAELTELDCGFSLMNTITGQFIFGASTDGVSTDIFPKGIVKANDKTSFNKWIKDWREMMLEKRKEELEAILSGIPDES